MFQTWQIALGALAALVIGFSKTGVPGAGILVVPIMAVVFDPRLSVGATLPLLIFADCFAVAYYRSKARWSNLRQLLPWVTLGLFAGTWMLKFLGEQSMKHDPLRPIIGWIVMAMLVLALLRQKLGPNFAPSSKFGTWITGVLAGFTTMTSNAAGPIMQIYLVSTRMPKEELMGTTATYFFIVNIAKLPFLFWLTWINPGKPLLTMESLKFDACMAPLIFLGALAGRKLLPSIPQKAFNAIVLTLSAIAAAYLIWT